jgi:predicted PurR-regulated permease PerM
MNKGSSHANGLAHTVLALLIMAILIAASFWVLQPFLTALVWATTIVVSTWPLMQGVQARLGGRRSLAVAVMTLTLLMVLIVPFSLAVATIISHTEDIVDWTKSLATLALPPPPDWVRALPMVGGRIVAKWEHVITIGPEGISAFLTPYAGQALRWFASISGSVGMMIIQFLLTILIAAIFYMRGDKAGTWLCLFARRIAGHHGESSLILAASAIRAVALGVVGTALIQSALGGLGLVISGVPATGILTALIFMLCLAQVGPVPVLIPAVIWLFWTDQTGWGIAMAAWTLFLGTIDNIISPLLMKKGADLPLLLVFAGVTGGLMVFGIIGLFVGPVVLAVSFTLLNAWVIGDETAGEQVCGEEALGNTDPA